MDRFAHWTTGNGSRAVSFVHAEFKDDDVTYVVVGCARGPYDTAQPYTVLRADECEIECRGRL